MLGAGSPICMPDDEANPDVGCLYDKLLEAMTNTVLRIVGNVDSLKLRHPVENYVHFFLQRMLNDVVPSDSGHGEGTRNPVCDFDPLVSCRPENLTEDCRQSGASSQKGSKRKSADEHVSPQQGPGSGSHDLSGKEEPESRVKTGKRPRNDPGEGNRGPYSCPFRKRNPQRFHVRESSCANQSYQDLALLKYAILNI